MSQTIVADTIINTIRVDSESGSPPNLIFSAKAYGTFDFINSIWDSMFLEDDENCNIVYQDLDGETYMIEGCIINETLLISFDGNMTIYFDYVAPYETKDILMKCGCISEEINILPIMFKIKNPIIILEDKV